MSTNIEVKDLLEVNGDSSLYKYKLDASKTGQEDVTVSLDQKDYTYLAVADVSHGKVDGRVVNQADWVFKLETVGDPHGTGAETGEVYWMSLWKYDLTVGEGEEATVKNVRVCERAVSDIKGVIDLGTTGTNPNYVVQFNDTVGQETTDVFPGTDGVEISNMKVYRVLTSELTALGLKLNTTADGAEELNKAYEKRDAILALLTSDKDVTKAYVDTVLNYAAGGADAAAKQLKGSDFNKLLTTKINEETMTSAQALTDDTAKLGVYDVVKNNKYYNGTDLNEVVDLNAEGAKELKDIEIAPVDLIDTGITPHTEGKLVGEFSYTVKDGKEDVELQAIAFGNDGNDTIKGTTGNDYIDGGAGADKIFGGVGTAIDEEAGITAATYDILKGGAGDNVIVAGSEDAVEFTATGDVAVDEDRNRLIDSTKLTKGIVDITAGDGDDVIVGGAGFNTINAGNGDNKIYAENGDVNIITAGSGSDKIYGGNGADVIYSGIGAETTVDEIYGGKGADLLVAGDKGAYTQEVGETEFTVKADKLTLGNAIIYGGEGDDTIIGGAGNNNIKDEDGNNTILAEHGTSADITTGSGNDTIKAGVNAVIHDAGGENTITAGADATIFTGDGDDTITAVSGTINAGTGDNKVTFTNVGTVTTGEGNDIITAQQGSTITAGAGNNTIILTQATDAGASTISFVDGALGTTTVYGVSKDDVLDFAKYTPAVAADPQTGTPAVPASWTGSKFEDLTFTREDVAATTGENATPAHNDLVITAKNRVGKVVLYDYFNSVAFIEYLKLNVLTTDADGNVTGQDEVSLADKGEIYYVAKGAFMAEEGYKESIIVNSESQLTGEAPIGNEFDAYIDRTTGHTGDEIVKEEYNDGIYSYYFKNPNTTENTYIDSLVIANDNDFVLDSTGNDVIKANKITSGVGDDTLIGVVDNSNSTVGAELKSHAGRDQIIGTAKNDTIDASSNDDGVYVNSLGGADTITTGNGNNIIFADGAAKITTGTGDDTITAGDGAEITDMGGKNKIIAGEDTTIITGEGNDTITAQQGSKIYAGAGDNTITVDGIGTIATSEGNDTITAAQGSKIYAGAGENTITLTGDVVAGTKIYFLDGVAGRTTIKGIGYTPADTQSQPATQAISNTLSFVKVTRDDVTTPDVDESAIEGLKFSDLTFTRVDEAAKYDDENTEVAAAHNDLVISYGEGETAGEVVLYDFFKNGAVVGDLNLEVVKDTDQQGNTSLVLDNVSLLEKGVIKYVASGAVKGTDYVEEITVDPDSSITSKVGPEFNAYIKRVDDTSTDTKYIVEEKDGDDNYIYKYDNIYKDDETSVNYADSIVLADGKNDTIEAGDFTLEEDETASNDVLIGHKLNGGYGNDLLIGTTADYTEGTDTVTKGATLIAGFEGNDTLIGTDKDDEINALFNRDGVYINAKGGKDKIEGGAGNDIIIAEGEGTVIDAGAGDDEITAGAESEITGGEGDDTISVKATNNKIYFLEDDFGDDTVKTAQPATATDTNTNTLVFAEQLLDADKKPVVDKDGKPIYTGLKFSELMFTRVDVAATETEDAHSDLFISSKKGTVTLYNYFNNAKNIDQIIALDETGKIPTTNTGNVVVDKPYSIAKDAKIVVDLDLINEEGAPASYEGKAFNEIIFGTEAANTINGGEGDDTIYGGAGSDVLNGGLGNDTIYAGDINEKGNVQYNSSAVEIYGGDGNDTIYSGTGNDKIIGGRGSDTIYLNGGKNSLYFTEVTGGDTTDNNVVYNSTNNDILYFATAANNGVKFNDLTFKKVDNDLEINVGVGAQTVTLKDYYKSANRADVIYAVNDGGTAVEKYSISKQGVEEITVAPDAKANYKGEDGDVVINAQGFESADGVKGMTITTGKGDNTITGTSFNDNIKAAKASKLTLVEELGNNKVKSGKGDDVLTALGFSSNTANLGAGNNDVTLASFGTNKITTTGSGKNEFEVHRGNNTINTGKGDDTFTILAGSNTVKTKGGYNDFIVDGGVNKLTSGAKDDDYTITGGNNIINTGKGSDTITISGLSYNTITTKGSSTITVNDNNNNDVIYNTINAKGNAKSKNTFNINYGANVIKAAAGANTFNINGGVSNITGGKNVDTFNVVGDDIIATLNGGKGNDVYDLTKLGDDCNVSITDTKGKNELYVFDEDDPVYTLFDVKLGKKNKFTASKEMTINNSGELADDNIKYTGSVTYINGEKFDVKGIASDVAKWLRANTTCTSAFEAIEKHVDGVDELIKLYNVGGNGNI